MATIPLPLTAPDVVCFDDLDQLAGETASDLETLEQDVYHILIEEPGSNIDDPDRGCGVERILSGPASGLDGMTNHIESQLRKDARIDGAKAKLTKLAPGAALPDGTLLEDGGYLLEVEVVAGTAILGLSYSFSANGGLVPQ